MGFFRSKLRHGSLLALIALGLQLVLSFGHVHANSLHIAPLNLQSSAASAGSYQLPTPADHDGNGVVDFCAICAVTAMAGSLVLPSAVVLPLPTLVAEAFEKPAVVTWASGPRRAFFQPRAPPPA